MARPYLRSGAAAAPDSGALDLDRLLAATAPVSWGALLGVLPESTTTSLLAKARHANRHLQPSAAELPSLVEAAVARSRLPENMFGPFTVSAPTGVTSPPPVHWAHVDTGAMVNLVHRGVLHAFPELLQYCQPHAHSVRGVGGAVQLVTSILVGVPVSLGSNRAPGSSFSSDFYVLDIASYHWLFGLPLLAAVEGEVLCKPRILRFRLGAEGKGELVALPLVPRSSLPT